MRERFAAVIRQMRDDAITLGHPFLMLGVCSYMVSVLEETFPDTFNIAADKYSTKCMGTANENIRK